MSNVNPDGVNPADGQVQDPADGSDPQQQNKNKTVSWNTYDKAMGTLAKEKQARLELEQRLQKIEEDRMAAEGKTSELLQTYKSKYETLESAVKREKAERIKTQFDHKVQRAAVQKGFVDPDIATKIFSIQDFDVDDNGNVDENLLGMKIDELKTTKGYLFKNPASRVADGNPRTHVPNGEYTAAEIQKLTRAQMAEYMNAKFRPK